MTWTGRTDPFLGRRPAVTFCPYGHHPDCPYPTQPADTCPICQGIRKAAPDPEDR